MIIFKYIILILIFGCSCSAGILMSKKFKNRVEELREIKSVLNILETKIKFTYEPLEDIFREIIKMADEKNAISKIFEKTIQNMQLDDVTSSWEKALDTTKSSLNFNNEDINIVKGLGKLLR